MNLLYIILLGLGSKYRLLSALCLIFIIATISNELYLSYCSGNSIFLLYLRIVNKKRKYT